MQIRIFVIFFMMLGASYAFASDSNTCKSTLRDVLKRIIVLEKQKILSATMYKDSEIKNLSLLLSRYHFSLSETEQISNALVNQKSPADIDKIRTLVGIIYGKNEKKRALMLANFGDLLINDAALEKKVTKLSSKRDEIYLQTYEKLQSKYPEMDEIDLIDQSEKMGNRLFNQYKDLHFACRSNSWNKDKAEASGLYTKFTFGINLTSGIGSYIYHQRKKEKDFQWYGKLGYEIVWSLISGSISSRIMTDEKLSGVQKGLQRYVNGRITGVIDMGLYALLFGINKEQAQKQLDEKLKDPEYKKLLNQMITKTQDETFVAKFIHEVNYRIKELAFETGISEKKPLRLSELDLSKLNKEDLEDPQVKELLISAASTYSYLTNENQILKVGDQSLDRYSFHTLYAIPLMALSVPREAYIYTLLCDGKLSPRAAIFKAIAFYGLSKVILDQMYYSTRDLVINQ